MRRVHFIQGNAANGTWLTGEALRLLHFLYVRPPKSAMEWSRLCCKAGLCPVVIARTGLTYKAAS